MKFDQLSDSSNLQLYRLLSGVELPDFVKEAEVDSHETVQGLSKEAFADSLQRAYPIDTPARVYVSNAFFHAKKAALDKKYGPSYVEEVGGRIKEAAELFSISRELQAYNEALDKQAVEADPICVWESDEASLFPVRNGEELSKSAEVFEKNMNKYPFDWRTPIAQAFVEKAALFGVDELPDLVCKYAGLYFPRPMDEVRFELTRRGNKLQSKEAKENYSKLAEALDAVETISDMLKIAHIAHHIETEDGAYDRPRTAELLLDPVDVIFNLAPEKVAEMLNVVEMAGERYPIDELKKVSAERYKEAFGIEIDPSNESTLKDILPTMPLSDVSMFRELTGVQPIA